MTPSTPPYSLLPADFVAALDCLRDRVIFVTGAGQGLGRVAALAYAKHGATVILHGRDRKKLDAVYDEIEAAGGAEPAILTLDFLAATQAEYTGLAETIFAQFKRLDGIVHSAVHVAPLELMAAQTTETWQAYFSVNALAPIQITRACLPMLKRSPAANVIFVTEEHALTAKAYWGAFSATKNILTNVIATWRDELATSANLQSPPYMHLLLPGAVATHSRGVTHPGELTSAIRQPESLADNFLYLMTGHASTKTTNALSFIHDCVIHT